MSKPQTQAKARIALVVFYHIKKNALCEMRRYPTLRDQGGASKPFVPQPFKSNLLARFGKTTSKIAVVYVYVTRQNVILTLVDLKSRKGWLDTIDRKRSFLVRTVACVSSGQCGFRGKRKTAPFAINLTTKKLLKSASDLGYTHLRLVLRGNGYNRETILKTFLRAKTKQHRIPILSVTDVTLAPHNGCRPKNRKRR